MRTISTYHQVPFFSELGMQPQFLLYKLTRVLLISLTKQTKAYPTQGIKIVNKIMGHVTMVCNNWHTSLSLIYCVKVLDQLDWGKLSFLYTI